MDGKLLIGTREELGRLVARELGDVAGKAFGEVRRRVGGEPWGMSAKELVLVVRACMDLAEFVEGAGAGGKTQGLLGGRVVEDGAVDLLRSGGIKN